jgi:5-hydroxyisourate hydrolase
VTLSTHVLDAVLGAPAADLAVTLFLQVDGEWIPTGSGRTDSDGRLSELAVEVGVWQLRFDTGAYFARDDRPSFYPEVPVTFEVSDAEAHHHVPLLLSPFAYSTYRGS